MLDSFYLVSWSNSFRWLNGFRCLNAFRCFESFGLLGGFKLSDTCQLKVIGNPCSYFLQVEMLEAIAGVMGYGMETANKYKIKNSLGQVAPDYFVF